MISDGAKRHTAEKAARRIKLLREAREMLRRVRALRNHGDEELRRMEDELVKQMFEIGQLRKKPSNRVILQ